MPINILKMNKKAQIQSGESITVMIIVVILLVLGLVFFGAFQSDAAETRRDRELQSRAMSLAITAADMDEFKCTSDITRTENCLDYYKLIAFNQTYLDNFEFYFEKLGNVDIKIHFISEKRYPFNESLLVYRYTGEATRVSIPTQVPVIVYEPVTRRNIFSVMEIRVLR